MPDAYADICDRGSTHYITQTENQVYFDFNRYREQYFELMRMDDLYLGYYMHLVEDAFYRQFINNGEYRTPCSQEEVITLHDDYQILNSYIVNKYNIHNMFEKSVDLTQESIGKIAVFRINE